MLAGVSINAGSRYVGSFHVGSFYVGSYDAGVSVWPGGRCVDLPAASFLVAHPDAPVLYAVSEVDEGTVTALAIGSDRPPVPVSQAATGGAGPCHLAVTADGRHLLCANYDSGSVAVFALGADGALGPRTDLVQHHGSGPDPARQDGPHAHHVSVRGTRVTAVDLGTDTLYGYRLNPDGTLSATGTVNATGGPRHLAAAPTGLVYVADELSSTVSVYRDGERIHRRPATLVEPAGRNYPSEIALSSDGRYLRVANRGNDTIATFAVDGDGLTAVDEVASGGAWPRHFTVDGDRLLVANQYAGVVAELRIDPATGRSHPTGTACEVPAPACVLAAR
jgi:6-phosphogluconolactonase